MKKSKYVCIVILDILLLILFVIFIPTFLQNTVGSDVTVYENWGGEIDNPVTYRFGAGCLEITIILLKMIGFIVCQFLMKKKDINVKRIWIAVPHIVIGILGLIFIFVYADGYSFLYLLQHIVENCFS